METYNYENNRKGQYAIRISNMYLKTCKLNTTSNMRKCKWWMPALLDRYLSFAEIINFSRLRRKSTVSTMRITWRLSFIHSFTHSDLEWSTAWWIQKKRPYISCMIYLVAAALIGSENRKAPGILFFLCEIIFRLNCDWETLECLIEN